MTDVTRYVELPLFLGLTEHKENVFTDLVKMPSLFAFGDTFTGKTMWEMNVLLTLMKHLTPDRLKLVIIDTKMVDFYPFRESKYLMDKVIDNPGDAIDCFKGIENEIDNRYRTFSQAGVRNIDDYNEKSNTKMPYIVCLIDEIAEIIINFPKETESFIKKVCMMGRAGGIHLIAGTNEVMPEVMTPNLRLNLKNLMVFKMRSGRYATDYMQAYLEGMKPDELEKPGDHIYKPAYDEPIKLRGKYIPDEEVESIIRELNSKKVKHKEK